MTLSSNNIIEILAFLTSVACYRRMHPVLLRWFIPFLFFIVLIELTGRYVSKVLHQPNAWIYNISTTVEFLFYSFILFKSISTPLYRSVISSFILGYPILVVLNILFLQTPPAFHSYTMMVGCLAMVLFTCFYFREILLQSQKINLLRTPLFWIACGLFIFYAGVFFYHAFYQALVNAKVDFGGRVFKAINNSLIYVLYGCFIIAFICPRKTTKSL